MVLGDEITIGGLTLTADAALDDEEVALAFSNIDEGGAGVNHAGTYSFSGSLTGYSTGSPTGGSSDTVVFTSTLKGSSVSAISITDLGSTVQANTPTAGLDNDNQVSAQYTFNVTDSTSDAFKAYPGTYTFSNNYADNRLTLSGYVNGNYKEQTLEVSNVTQVALNEESDPQYLNFSTFGFTLNLNSIVGDSDPTILASEIVDGMDGKFIEIAGESARVTNINVSGAEAGSYRFSEVSGVGNETKLRLDFEDPSDPGSENWVKTAIIDLADIGVWNDASDNQFLARQTYRLGFESLGISLDIHAFQDMDTSDIVTLIADSGGNGDLIVSAGTVNSLKFQSGPNSDSFIEINTLDIKTTDGSGSLKMQAVGAGIDQLSALAASNSEDETAWGSSFAALDSSIENAQIYLSQERAVFGSQMNRLGYLSTNLTAQSTNLQNSRSSIIDTDFAAETAKLTRGQIMQQAATAMLAQANQMPNVVLSLLK
jgi:flagellin-like hook-associated protein FlgL